MWTGSWDDGKRCPQATGVKHSQLADDGGTVCRVTASPDRPGPRFLTLADVAETLSISSAQVYALVRRNDIRAVKIGGRGQWRVEVSELEAYIARLYEDTAKYVDEHPFVEGSTVPAD